MYPHPRLRGKLKLMWFNDLDVEKGSAMAYPCSRSTDDLVQQDASSTEYLSYTHPARPTRKFSLPAL
jgi:hypothetical protein